MKNIQTLTSLFFVVAVFSGVSYYYGMEETFEGYIKAGEEVTIDQPEVRARELFEYANEARGSGNELIWNDCLAEKAIERASDIYETRILEHTNANGEEPFIGMIQSCGNFPIRGENLSGGYTNARDAHFGLMQSLKHRGNILDTDYSEIGIGCFEDACVVFFAG